VDTTTSKRRKIGIDGAICMLCYYRHMTERDKYLLGEKESNLIRRDDRGRPTTITEGDKERDGSHNAQHSRGTACGRLIGGNITTKTCMLNHLNPTVYVMHHQLNIQQLYALPTLYLCVLCLSENKQRLVSLTA